MLKFFLPILTLFCITSKAQVLNHFVCEPKETIIKTMGSPTLTIQRCTKQQDGNSEKEVFYEIFGLNNASRDIGISRLGPKEIKTFSEALNKVLQSTQANAKDENEYYTLNNDDLFLTARADRYGKWQYNIDYDLKSTRKTSASITRKELEHFYEYLSKQ